MRAVRSASASPGWKMDGVIQARYTRGSSTLSFTTARRSDVMGGVFAWAMGVFVVVAAAAGVGLLILRPFREPFTGPIHVVKKEFLRVFSLRCTASPTLGISSIYHLQRVVRDRIVLREKILRP